MQYPWSQLTHCHCMDRKMAHFYKHCGLIVPILLLYCLYQGSEVFLLLLLSLSLWSSVMHSHSHQRLASRHTHTCLVHYKKQLFPTHLILIGQSSFEVSTSLRFSYTNIQSYWFIVLNILQCNLIHSSVLSCRDTILHSFQMHRSTAESLNIFKKWMIRE